MKKYVCEKKSLSEIMKKVQGEELIFSAVGPHTGNDFKETMDKKLDDMAKFGFCLWAIRKSEPIDEIKRLCKGKEEVYVVLVENPANQNTKSGYHAVDTDDPKIKIPVGMEVTGTKSSQAYVVDKIIEITDGKDGNFSRSRYDVVVSDFHGCNQLKRFNTDRKERRDSEHEVRYVLVLNSSHIVTLKMEKIPEKK